MKISPAEAAAMLPAFDNYLILTHRRPDGDTTGCASGLCRALRGIGKTAHVLNNPEFPVRYLPFVSDLLAPESMDADGLTVVTVDTSTVELLPEIALPLANRVVLALDHHSSNTLYAASSVVRPDMAACGEAVYEVIRELGAALTQDIALALYLAIATDTGCFRYANTSSNSHRVVAELMETGVDVSELNYDLFMLKSKNRMILERDVMDSMEFYAGGRVAVCCVTREMIKNSGIDERDTEDVSSLTRQIEGVEVGITIRETPDVSACKGSVRTSGAVNASNVCALLGGGGHLRAGGFTYAAGRDETRMAALDALIRLHPEFGS